MRPSTSCSYNAFTSYAVSLFRFLSRYYYNSVECLSKSFLNCVYWCCAESVNLAPSTPASVSAPAPSCFTSSQFSSCANSINFFYCNARSVLPKASLISHYASICDPCVIALTETWLDNSILSSLFTPQGYSTYRHDRSFGSGGRSLIMVKVNGISAHLSVLSPHANPDHRINAVACQLSFDDTNILGILSLYRPLNSSVDDNLLMCDIIANFLHLNIKHNIIIGDFNFPEIQWPHSSTSHQGNTVFFSTFVRIIF